MGAPGSSDLTAELARRAASVQLAELPEDVVERARQALLDWFAVTLAGSAEPAPRLACDAISADVAGETGCTVIGRELRLPARDAALVNGTASHALDFDDVNMRSVCHVSAALLGALVALGEKRDASGAQLLAAYVAGYETACRVAATIGPEPYLRGFHTTGTVGAFGAAAACSRLIGLDPTQTAQALGIAASGAAGLKRSFGTMTKPLHAGRACETGVLAAGLAARGFTAGSAAIEGEQGFAAISGVTCDAAAALADPPEGWHLRENLFKFHAACYFAHSAIEGALELREQHDLKAHALKSIRLHVGPAERGACTIAAPSTGLEAKFSIAHLVAMALLGRDTAKIEDEAAADEEAVAVRELVELTEARGDATATLVEVTLLDGSKLEAEHETTAPESDLARQRARLESKFDTLAAPVIGDQRGLSLRGAIAEADRRSVRELAALARG